MVRTSGKRVRSLGKTTTLFAKLIKLALFVGVTGVLLYSLLTLVPRQYRSTSTLHIEGQAGSPTKLVSDELRALGSTSMMQSFLDQHRQMDGLGFNNATLKKSPLNRVLMALGLMDDPALTLESTSLLAGFKENLSINRGTAAQTIEISLRSGDPQAAARLVNLYAQYYIAVLEAQNTLRPSSMAIDKQTILIARLRDEISSSETKLAALRQDMRVNPIVKVAQSSGILAREILETAPVNELDRRGNVTLSLEQLSQLTAQLILAKADREQAELRAKLVHDMLDTSGRIESTNNVLNTGLAQKLLLRRARMEKRLSELSIAMLPSHPQMRSLNRLLAALRVQIEAETKKAVADLDNEVLIAAAREDSLKQSLAKLKNPRAKEEDAPGVLSGVVASIIEPAIIDPRMAQMGDIIAIIAKKRRELLAAQVRMKTPARSGGASSGGAMSAKVISPAIANSQPVFPKKQPITLLGMFAAFVLGLFALLLDGRGRQNAPLERGASLTRQTANSDDEDLAGMGKEKGPKPSSLFAVKLLDA